jgi:PAS domain-containing protein
VPLVSPARSRCGYAVPTASFVGSCSGLNRSVTKPAKLSSGTGRRPILKIENGRSRSSIDVQAPAMISTILLMDPDGKRLWHVAGPQVPSDWLPAISPRPIGPREGCCGAAAFLRERVIVGDVAADPIWTNENRDLAIKNGIRAAWSQPILGKDGQLLGTFALYASEPRIPTSAELELIEGAGHIARIAIERQRSQEALRKALDEIRESEAELRRITDAIPQAINVLGVDGRTLYANKVTLEYAGLGLEHVTSPDFRERLFHPEDVERVRNESGRARGGNPI